MTENMNQKKIELTNCDDCASKNLTPMPEKGETWCDDCGLVHKDQKILANDNGGALFGEGAHYQAVRQDADMNRNIGGTGPKMRFGSKGVHNPRKYRLLEKIDRSTVRNPHPFANRVKRNIEQLYGRHALHILEYIVEMSCKPLTGEQEQIRKKQAKSLKKRLGMPKQSICRKDKGIKGSSEEQNAVIIAAAIVELAGELGIMPKFDRRSTMAKAEISPKQISNARIRILQHWKARLTMDWAVMPPRKNANDRREDSIAQAMEHVFEMLGDQLAADDFERVLYETETRLALLNEGTGGALTINIEPRMVVCVTAYASLNFFGLQSGAADLLADVFGLTSSGIRSRYDALVKQSEAGAFHDAGAFDVSKPCYDVASDKHAQNALISKVRLGNVCGRRSSLP
jgi:hypothetical protein